MESRPVNTDRDDFVSKLLHLDQTDFNEVYSTCVALTKKNGAKDTLSILKDIPQDHLNNHKELFKAIFMYPITRNNGSCDELT